MKRVKIMETSIVCSLLP